MTLEPRGRVAPRPLGEVPDRERQRHRADGAGAPPQVGPATRAARRQSTTSTAIAVTSSTPNARLPAMCTTGTSASIVPTSSQAATIIRKTWKKNTDPWPTSRIRAYAAANDAIRYMLSRSRWPPSAEPVACIAALAGPSSTVTTAYAVGRPRSRGSTSPSSRGCVARHATARPATTNPRFERLLAGWTVTEGPRRRAAPRRRRRRGRRRRRASHRRPRAPAGRPRPPPPSR